MNAEYLLQSLFTGTFYYNSGNALICCKGCIDYKNIKARVIPKFFFFITVSRVSIFIRSCKPKFSKIINMKVKRLLFKLVNFKY